MKTVYDLIRHGMTLEIICRNCDHNGFVNHRFLVARFGNGQLLSALRFKCRRCSRADYRLRLVPSELGESPPLKMQWFGGAYDNFRD